MVNEISRPEFKGFANAPVNDEGERIDFRDVPAYEDESREGQVRRASQTTESSIVAHKTEGKGTNGAPAAVVPAPSEDPEGDEPEASEDPAEDPEDPESEE